MGSSLTGLANGKWTVGKLARLAGAAQAQILAWDQKVQYFKQTQQRKSILSESQTKSGIWRSDKEPPRPRPRPPWAEHLACFLGGGEEASQQLTRMKGSFPAAAQKEGRELPSPPHDGLQKLKSLGLASPAAPQEEGRELPSNSPGGGEGASQPPQEEGSSSPRGGEGASGVATDRPTFSVSNWEGRTPVPLRLINPYLVRAQSCRAEPPEK